MSKAPRLRESATCAFCCKRSPIQIPPTHARHPSVAPFSFHVPRTFAQIGHLCILLQTFSGHKKTPRWHKGSRLCLFIGFLIRYQSICWWTTLGRTSQGHLNLGIVAHSQKPFNLLHPSPACPSLVYPSPPRLPISRQSVHRLPVHNPKTAYSVLNYWHIRTPFEEAYR